MPNASKHDSRDQQKGLSEGHEVVAVPQNLKPQPEKTCSGNILVVISKFYQQLSQSTNLGYSIPGFSAFDEPPSKRHEVPRGRTRSYHANVSTYESVELATFQSYRVNAEAWCGRLIPISTPIYTYFPEML